MTTYQYYPEPSLDPPEPKIAGHCPVCGEEIYMGSKVRMDGDVMIHPECILDYITGELSADLIADLLKYGVGIA